jgi:signal transduction histidine kinase
VSDNVPGDGAELLALLRATQERLRTAEEAQRRAALLADAGALLFESLDHREVLERLARLVVRWFADWCMIDLLEDGDIVRVAGAHADPEKQPIVDELRLRYPPRWTSPHPSTQVLKTGQPVLLRDISAQLARQITVDDEHARLGTVLGARSGMSVALTAHGRVLGALTAGSVEPARFDTADLDLMLELARRAAVAIENAQLHHQSQEAVRLRDEFLSVAAHELNTPMAALMLSLEGLGAPEPELQLDPKGMVQVARLAERQGRRLTKLIRDLLDVTRLSRGALSLDYEDLDLTALVREVVARYKPELERAGCDVSLTLEGPVPGQWDGARLDQVVLNLLANAARFGARKPIAIRVERVGGDARLTVSDQGIGVDASQHQRIFERFERGVTSHQYGGLGLGLYICRRIVESHGGSIAVESRVGQGATFTVSLPLSPEAP